MKEYLVIANFVGGVSAEEIMKMRPDEQILLVEEKPVKCKQARYYDAPLFRPVVRGA